MPCKEVSCKQINGVSICDKVEVFGDFAQLNQNVVNGINSGNIVPISLNTVGRDNFLGGIKKEKDVMPNTADFDIGFVAAVESESSYG